MSVFVDSSALVKLYSDEPGHEPIRALDLLVVSHLARVEVPAALWRKQRMDELTPDQAQVLTEEFEADYFGTDDGDPRFVAVKVTAEVLDSAARLCAGHSLRAYDGVQLASAIAARTQDPACRQMAAFDTALRRAAAGEGFALLPTGA